MSLSKKTKKWLQKNGAVSLRGKTVLVTGATSGVGYKTAEIAAYLGADLILACRNPGKAQDCAARLSAEYPGIHIDTMTLDLASFASIAAFAKELREKQIDLHAFVNNAGAFHHPGERTADGFDLVIGTNFLGVYALSEKVLPYLETLPHEVLYLNTVSLILHFAKEIDYADFYCEKHPRSISVYARSKLCLAKYSWAKAQKLMSTNIKVQMNHPGVAITPLGLNAVWKWLRPLERVVRPFFNSPEKSALASIYLLTKELPAGCIVGPKRLFWSRGYPKVNRVPKKVKTGAQELIAFTERELVKKDW